MQMSLVTYSALTPRNCNWSVTTPSEALHFTAHVVMISGVQLPKNRTY